MVEASPVEVKNAKFWINEGFARPRKTINKNISSYGLKHLAERQVGSYISNEAMIQAMLESGFRAQQISGTPNYFFNVKLTEV
jgi:hypothetical protein